MHVMQSSTGQRRRVEPALDLEAEEIPRQPRNGTRRRNAAAEADHLGLPERFVCPKFLGDVLHPEDLRELRQDRTVAPQRGGPQRSAQQRVLPPKTAPQRNAPQKMLPPMASPPKGGQPKAGMRKRGAPENLRLDRPAELRGCVRSLAKWSSRQGVQACSI